MKKGTTKSGFDFTIDEAVLDNMELVDDLEEIDSGNALAISRVCVKVLGKEQRDKLYDHLRIDGRVPIKAVTDEITEIFNLVNAKN